MSAPGTLSSGLHEFVLSNHLYVDKGAQLISFIKYMYEQPRLSSPNVYLIVRPRGFGLTIAVEAIEALLMHDELISGDLIDEDMRGTLPHLPVVHLSLRKMNISTVEQFQHSLIELMQMQLWEHHLNKTLSAEQNPKSAFAQLLSSIYQQTGQPVAVLIDNYDVPLLNTISLEPEIRKEAVAVYLDVLNAIKQARHKVALCLLTGHIKFDLSSMQAEGLPYVRDLSYSAVCDTLFGFTEDELRKAYSEEIKRYAPRQGVTAAEMLQALIACYGGFCFSDRMLPVLCPASVNAALENECTLLPYQADADYTFVKYALRHDPDLSWLFDKDGQDALFLDSVPLEPQGKDAGVLLLQLGFATINKVTRSEGPDYINWRYRFAAPNEEMRRLLRILRHEASEELARSPINPLVLADGAHDFDIERKRPRNPISFS